MSSTDHPVPNRAKRNTRASAAARIQQARNASENFTNSPSRRRKASTLSSASSASCLKTGKRTPSPERRLPRQFGSSASFDCILDRGSPLLRNSIARTSKSKENLTARESGSGSRGSPVSLVSVSPLDSSPPNAGHSPSPTLHTSTTSRSATLGSRSANATRLVSVTARPTPALSIEDCAARFVNRLTLDLCANSSLFSDVCDAQLLHEKQDAAHGEYGIDGGLVAAQASSITAAQRMETSTAGSSRTLNTEASSPRTYSESGKIPATLDMADQRKRSTSSALSTLSPEKEPVLSPKDGMMFSYFDVPVSEQAAERKPFPLIPTNSDRSTGIFRRTLCVNTSTISPDLLPGPRSATGTLDSADAHTLSMSSPGYDSADGGGSEMRRGSGSGHFGGSSTCSPIRSQTLRNGSVSSERHGNIGLPRRSKSTRVLSRLFDRVFRRHQSWEQEQEEERGNQLAAARVDRTPSTSTSSNMDAERRGQLSPTGGDALASSCTSLNDRGSLSDSAEISMSTPEPQQSGGLQDSRGDRVRRTLTKIRGLTGRRSSASAASLERSTPPGMSVGSQSQRGDDFEDAGIAVAGMSRNTPECATLSSIPQSPPDYNNLTHYPLANGNGAGGAGRGGGADPRDGPSSSPAIHQARRTNQEATRTEQTRSNERRGHQYAPSSGYHPGRKSSSSSAAAVLRSSPASPPQYPTRPASTDGAVASSEHRLERRLSGDLHGKAVNSVSPSNGSPTASGVRRAARTTAPVLIRESARRASDSTARGRLRPKSHSVEEDGVMAALLQAQHSSMDRSEYERLKTMMLIPDDDGGGDDDQRDGKIAVTLSPPLSPKKWSVSMDHLSETAPDGGGARATGVRVRQHNHRDLARQYSYADQKYVQSANASPAASLPPRLNIEASRSLSSSLSSLFKRKSVRSSTGPLEMEHAHAAVTKLMSNDSMGSPAKLPAVSTTAPGHYRPASSAGEAWPEAYGPILAGSAGGRRHSSPPPIDFHPPTKPKSEMTHEDMRQHVVQTLLDTEMKYVGSLRTLVRDYFSQLKRNNHIDPALVEEIFFQVPVINLCHKRFNQQLRERADKWHSRSVLGDIFLQSFSKGILSHAYTAYINHFMQMKDALRTATAQRPAFAKFLEQVSRESEDKLTLSDLLIMPVQRIPRYVLIIKDLLKHCPYDHPDHGPLLQALDAMCALAEKMNRSEEQSSSLELLREIELCFNGVVPGLVAPHRQLVRKDRVSEVVGSQTKERLLILMNDVLLCATVRRRTGSRKGPISHAALMSSSDANIRYKLMWRAMVKDISVIQTQEEVDLDQQAKQEIGLLEKDLIALSEISVKCESLVSPHQELYQSINSMIKAINDGIQDRKGMRELATLTLTVESKNSRVQALQHILVFQSSEEKGLWIQDYKLTKEKLDEPIDGRDSWHRADSETGSVAESSMLMSVNPTPRYLYNIPMMKTRSGMQITCACPSVAPGHLTPAAVAAKANGQLWVCASDGHVGQVCMVNTEKLSPRLTACITVCDSRITCIIAVPEYVPSDIQHVLQQREVTKLISGHHMSYDSESDNENELSGDDQSQAAMPDAKSTASGHTGDTSSPTSAEQRLHDSHTTGSLLDRRLPSTVSEENEATSPITAAAPSQDQLKGSQLHNFGTKMTYVRSSPQFTRYPVHHILSDGVLKTEGTAESTESASPHQSKSKARDSSNHTDGAGETGDETPVPSSPANFLRDSRLNDDAGNLISSTPVPVTEVLRESDKERKESSAPDHPSHLSLHKTFGEASSHSSTSVASPVDDNPRGNANADASSSAGPTSPVRRLANATRSDSTEDVFVAAALLSRVRHFNSLAESVESPTKIRPAAVGGGQAGNFVDSGIIAGDEGSASSTGGVSRSGSDVSSRSNGGSRPRAAKPRGTARSQSLSEGHTRVVGRSFSQSTVLVAATQRQKISAAHLIVSQQTNNLASDGKRSMDHDPTMWLGTENGLLYIYRAGDSIRMRQRRTMLRLKYAVVDLCHTRNTVYVSLSDGHLIVFSRNQGGNWDTRDPEEIITNLPCSIVTSMTVVDSDVWCACRDRVLVIGSDSCFVKKSIVVGRDPSAKVSYIACRGLCVYVAMETGSVLHCYNSANHEHLFSIDTMASVAQMLTGCDTIIRQHKINCLRITALESHGSLLWAGTSAGVVLTIPCAVPRVTRTTTARDIAVAGGNEAPPQPSASYNGHTGPVRFITVTERFGKQPVGARASSASSSNADAAAVAAARDRVASGSELSHSAASSVHSTPLRSGGGAMTSSPEHGSELSKYVASTDVEALVVTGGDGFEDFKATPIADNDDFTQDDSSSHLLIWQMA